MSYFKTIKDTEEGGRNVREPMIDALLTLEDQIAEISDIENEMFPANPILTKKIKSLIQLFDNDLEELFQAVMDEERKYYNKK